jgi:glutathione peroxidase
MRSVVALVGAALGLMVLAGCGGSDASTDEPAAARDASVQEVTTTAPAESSRAAAPPTSSGVLRGTYKRLDGTPVDLASYHGKVALIVNTATECGFTPQFEGLEQLYKERRARGLVVLGFPANDFAQESRSNGEIASFCKENYGVSFPMFGKTVVTGDGANPLYRRLIAKAGAPEWNFNKYLINRDGKVVARFGSGTEPGSDELVSRIDSLL